MKQQANELMERGKELVAEGNQRQVTLRGKSGRAIGSTSLTVVAAGALVLLVTGFMSWPLVVIAGLAAWLAGLRVELSDVARDV